MSERMSYEEYLEQNGSLTYTNKGVSMLPLLRQGRDLFTVRKKGKERCKAGDVVLYRRQPDQYVLHRIIKVRPRDYVIRGDNCIGREYGVTDEDILGVMTGFVRGGKKYTVDHPAYQLYSFVWMHTAQLRICVKKCILRIKKKASVRHRTEEIQKSREGIVSRDKTMTKEEYRKVMEDVIRLAVCAVNGVTPDAERIRRIDLKHLYPAAEQHLLTAIVAHALESAGIHDMAFIQAKAKAIRKLALMDAEMSVLSDRLEHAGIWYMPLKGTVLKGFYPAYGLREMADHDILIDADRAEDVKAIMEEMGFRSEHFGAGNHDCYYKEPVCNFEMHRALFGKGNPDAMQAYYENVKARLLKDEGRHHGYHFSPEDFYVYMIAHEYKHYSAGGTGLRSLLDTYVYLQKNRLNMEYVSAETEKLGIREFEETNRTLSLKLFARETLEEQQKVQLTAEETELFENILYSGTYGTQENAVRNRMKKVTGEQGKVTGRMRLRYYLNRLFPKQELLYPWYPPAKYKVLIPFVWIYRLLVIAVVRRKRVLGEIRTVEKQDKI